MFGTNATVRTLRRPAMDPATKQTAAYAPYLSNVRCYIRDDSMRAHAIGMAVEYELALTCPTRVDIRDGDIVAGWNPLHANPEPTYIVKHAAPDMIQLGGWRICYLVAYRA
jgi:hypothetical protein